MATVTIKHASLTGAAANPAVLVDGPKWDASHMVTGLENVPNVDTTNASNLTSGTVPAAQMPALTGDVTTVAGGVATTIGANKVTRAMQAQGSARSVIGVIGNATANVADIQGTANQALVVNSAGTSLGFGAVNLASSSAVTGVLPVANYATGTPTGSKFVRDDGVLAVPTAASGVTSLNGQTGSLALYIPPQCRITLTQGTAITSSDVTAATSIYLEPYLGSQLSLYDGSANWIPVVIAPSTYSLPATQSQSGATHTNTTIDGLTDTSQMIVGMQVTGTNVAANTTIATIVSGTSITVNNATTGSATNTMTFKLAPSTVFDIFAFNNSSVPKLEWGPAWTNDTTRSTGFVLQDGVEVKSGATTRRLLGSVRTTTIAGQLEDSHLRRWVSNRYNDQPRPMYVNDATATWVYSTATLRQANANTANQLDYLATIPRFVSAMSAGTAFAATTAGTTFQGVGVDSATTDSSQIRAQGSAGTTYNTSCFAVYSGNPGVGRHTLVWLEAAGGSGITWTGTAGAVTQTLGMTGWVSN